MFDLLLEVMQNEKFFAKLARHGNQLTLTRRSGDTFRGRFAHGDGDVTSRLWLSIGAVVRHRVHRADAARIAQFVEKAVD